jgi:hypothetical protein
MFHIVLVQPQIPPNTGNIMRLCANTACTLHLVKPLGFELEGKAVRRAGLDYREVAQLAVHADFPACLQALRGARLFSIETSGSRPYSEAAFAPGDALLRIRDARARGAGASGNSPRAAAVHPDARRQPQPQSLQRGGAGALRGVAPERIRLASHLTRPPCDRADCAPPSRPSP